MNDLYSRAPHRPAAQAEAHSPHAALLIDFDNVTMGIRSNLGQELRKLLDSDIIRGKVSVQRAYADWRRYPQYIASLSEASIDLIFAPAYGSTKKNATDIRLAIDALEIVFIRPEIGTFILLSGDSDFSSLVLKLKEYGKYVIGVGIQESSSDLLVQNCDEYYSYNSLSGLTSATDMQNIEKHDPWQLAAKSIRRMVDRGDVMRSDRFKQVMLELDPGFSEKSIGFSKFNRFLTEAASRGILDLRKAANGQYEVSPGARVSDFEALGVAAGLATERSAPKEKPREEKRARGRRGDENASESRSRRGGSSRAPEQPDMSLEAPPEVDEDRLRQAYALLRSVVEARAGRDGIRDSEVKRHMLEKDGGFDEAVLGFRKFSRFLRQAHDEEVINLERTDEGNYRVRSVAEPRTAGKTAREGSKAETAPAEERDRRSGRKPRRDRRDDKRGRPRREEPEEERPAASVEAAPAAQAEAAGEEAKAAGAGDAKAEAPGPETDDRKRTGLLGRRRKPTRAAPGSKVIPGPVDEPEGAASETRVEETAPRAKPQTRSTGLFRRGARSAHRQASPEPATATPSASSGSGDGERASGGGEGALPVEDAVELIEHMSRGYQGVGRRTAERLVEEFGDEVFEVIDNDPDRIISVLPKGRAQAVIDGRRAELEADGEDGSRTG